MSYPAGNFFRRWSLRTMFMLGVTVLPCPFLTAQNNVKSFQAEQGHFVLDGQPFRILSGEMHYPRIPRAEWRARLKMAKAMGLNTITTYAFWNLHETQPGVYDFTGQNDIAEFLREAQQEGLYVILRPGPFVCAEWEWGGYPSWLLKDKDIVVRSSDPKFIGPTTTWLKRLGQELAPLQIGNGGPIIAVQVENEYGSFGDDHAYMEQIKHILQDSGFTKAMLYTADGPEQLPKGALPELPAVINFGTGGAEKGFAKLHELRPDGPFMSGEYWAGWFDHWGEKHHQSDGDKEAAELDWMLKHGYSVSMYMFNGGTSFGWMNGANSSNGDYEPDTTSYDYDAPLNESGQETAKYFKFRDVIAKDTGATLPPIPANPKLQNIPAFPLASATTLWKNLPTPIHSDQLKSMEDLGQAYGYILYRTKAPANADGDLVIDGLHDYAQIYADGKLLGTLDRRLGQSKLHVAVKKGQRLDFLVENSGRVNFTTVLRGERKGILGDVTVAATPLHGWSIYTLPLLDTTSLPFRKQVCKEAPCFYRGTFRTDSSEDTYLDTTHFTKGFVWINGHPLGRIWSIGPQHTLFTPGSWLKPGENEVIVLDLSSADQPSMQGLEKPLFDQDKTKK